MPVGNFKKSENARAPALQCPYNFENFARRAERRRLCIIFGGHLGYFAPVDNLPPVSKIEPYGVSFLSTMGNMIPFPPQHPQHPFTQEHGALNTMRGTMANAFHGNVIQITVEPL